jgi:arsenical pump membrane protein
VPDPVALALALVALAATLSAAVSRPARLPEGVLAAAGALVLVVLGAVHWTTARGAVADLAPTVGFLAALLLLAEGCRREGLFAALGRIMARRAQTRPLRLLSLVFAAACAVTAVLGLDATVVLLTPVVFVTASRLGVSAKPHAYACTHLANSASLLLVVSNLTNLLAFRASRLSFTHFAVLMALPWLGVVGIEWLVLRRFFAAELDPPTAVPPPVTVAPERVRRYPLAVLALTLLGFALSSPLHVAAVWFAVAGAAAVTAPGLLRRSVSPQRVLRSLEPGFLCFVLGLGVIVAAASGAGLGSAVQGVLPAGASLPDLLGIAAISALLANLLNNLPATLILLPVAAGLGTGPVLAVLIGVNIGPNLTYSGSLATLLWRRVLRAEGATVQLREFTALGLLTVPVSIVVATCLLWAALG